jgi:hypothetical protein
MFWFQKDSGGSPCPVGYGLSLTESFLNSIQRKRQGELSTMTKRLLLLAGLLLALGTILSADYPLPPCDPDCPPAGSGQFIN